MIIHVNAVAGILMERKKLIEEGETDSTFSLEEALSASDVGDITDLEKLAKIAAGYGDTVAEKILLALVSLLQKSHRPAGMKLKWVAGKMVDRGPTHGKKWKEGYWEFK